MFSYNGKKVLVTGGGRGIGRATALAMAEQGASVCVVSRSEDELSGTAEDIRTYGVVGEYLTADLSDPSESTAIVSAASKKLGGLDVLVNNAGGGSSVPGGVGSLEEASQSGLQGIYALNLQTPFFLCLEAVRVMKEDGGGSILNVVSIDALAPAPGEAVYGSAKAALISLTESLAVEMGQYNVTVNAIAPALIDTALVQRGLKDEAQRVDRASYYPINRIGRPEDVAASAVYLCSEEASWISGVTLKVAGGQQVPSDLFRWLRNTNTVPDDAKI